MRKRASVVVKNQLFYDKFGVDTFDPNRIPPNLR